MKISGNTILITGATSGIGRAFAEQLLKEGNKIIICGRREKRLEEIQKEFPGIVTKVTDIADGKQREDLAHWVREKFPELNVLINNAGIQLTADLTKPLDLQRVHAEVDTNLIAPIHLTSLLAEHLAAQPEGSIINISSGLAFTPLAFVPVYCATKAAIHSYTLSLRYQLRNTAIKVFEIAPPAVDTELGADRREDPNETHGGLPIADFIKEAMEALKTDKFEAAIANAKNLHDQRENLFGMLNR